MRTRLCALWLSIVLLLGWSVGIAAEPARSAPLPSAAAVAEPSASPASPTPAVAPAEAPAMVPAATPVEVAPGVRVLDIAPVWSGHPVEFALLTAGRRQYVAFFDADRQMTVAARTIDEPRWQLVRLPSVLGWDSHNYVTMAVDAQGHLHVSGNMHCNPLVYFRTERPGDIESFRPEPAMVGRNEKRCTYPRFLHGLEGELIFTYRDGSSGNGDQYFNVYDPTTRLWRRLLDAPLFAGEGKMNAYFVGPERDAAGVFHICWVWRDTPDCATNHDLCYARSKDLVHWETSDGRPLALPITLAKAEVVDPVPPGGGMINGNTRIGFDGQGRPVLSYHKFDTEGHTQLFNARRETDGWRIYQTSQWDYRWEFKGGGTIRFEIGFGPVVARPDGLLTQSWRHIKYGTGRWTLDPQTLRPVTDRAAADSAGGATGKVGGATSDAGGTTGSVSAAGSDEGVSDRAAAQRPARRGVLPKSFGQVESDWPGMEVRTAEDLGKPDVPVRYILRWETLPSNRDRPRSPPLPPPSMLRLYEIDRR